ncbi:MAG: DUF4339 domain-containing protein [Deltaproteobacteria bacterium]|nr:DUF4339 domain-containing protein [Deltaproteobacteria bacterium]
MDQPEMDSWYYSDSTGGVHGPMPAAQVVELFSAGTISETTLVWQHGWSKSKQFCHSELFPAKAAVACKENKTLIYLVTAAAVTMSFLAEQLWVTVDLVRHLHLSHLFWFAAAILGYLNTARKRLTAPPEQPTRPGSGSQMTIQLCVLLIVVGIVLVCVAQFRPPVHFIDLALDSLRFGVPLANLAMFLVPLPATHVQPRRAAVIYSYFLLGFMFFACGAEAILNSSLSIDTCKPTFHRVQIDAKKLRRHDDGSKFHSFTYRLWDTDEIAKITPGLLPKAQFDKITPGVGTMSVLTCPGAFGFDWIAGAKVFE